MISYPRNVWVVGSELGLVTAVLYDSQTEFLYGNNVRPLFLVDGGYVEKKSPVDLRKSRVCAAKVGGVYCMGVLNLIAIKNWRQELGAEGRMGRTVAITDRPECEQLELGSDRDKKIKILDRSTKIKRIYLYNVFLCVFDSGYCLETLF